jgi:hypothetical protein
VNANSVFGLSVNVISSPLTGYDPSRICSHFTVRLDVLLIFVIWVLLLLLLLLLLLSSISPLCGLSTRIFLRQTMSLGNIVLQLF